MKGTMNDNERRIWVGNDEGLYRLKQMWCCSNKGGMRGFIKANRAEIDAAINKVLNPKKVADWRKYT